MSNFLELKSTPTSLVAERNKLEGVKEREVPHSSDGEVGGLPERDGKLCLAVVFLFSCWFKLF